MACPRNCRSRCRKRRRSPEAIALLKELSHKPKAALASAYATLALFRLREEGPYERMLYESLGQKHAQKIVSFRPQLPRTSAHREGSFELTPEESSRLLIESYAAIADRHDNPSLEALLQALKNGNPKNRPIIAGLLLRAIQ